MTEEIVFVYLYSNSTTAEQVIQLLLISGIISKNAKLL